MTPYRKGYNAMDYYNSCELLRTVLDQVATGFFNIHEPHFFQDFVQNLIRHDRFKLCADFEAYVECQDRVSQVYKVGQYK